MFPVVRLCLGTTEGWEVFRRRAKHFWALIKSRGVVLGLESNVEAGSKSGCSERKLR